MQSTASESKVSGVGRLILGLVLATVTVALMIWQVEEWRSGDKDWSLLGCALMAAALGAFFIVVAVGEIKAFKAAKNQTKQEPELYFDRIQSIWAEKLGDFEHYSLMGNKD